MGFLKTFALFLLIVIAILVPFGLIFSISIGKYYGFSINIGILSGFIGNICVKRSENRHLRQNVDALDTCKRSKNRHLPELLQQLVRKLVYISSTIYKTCTTCILSIKLAWDVQYK